MKRDLGQVCEADPDEDLYLPVKTEEYWQCICKKPSLNGKACSNCGAEYDKLEELLSQSRLREKQKKAVMERAQSRAEKTVPAFENARVYMYARAKEMANGSKEQDLREAISIFEKLGDYEDAKNLASQAKADLPALIEKAQAEKKAKAEKKAREAEIAKQEAEAKKKTEEKQQKETSEKRGGKVLLTVLAFAISYVMGRLHITSIVISILTGMYIRRSSAAMSTMLAMLPAVYMMLAIVIFAKLIKKTKLNGGKMFLAMIFVFAFQWLRNMSYIAESVLEWII